MAKTIAVSSTGTWQVTLSGLCAILVGIGLARFAYSPLIPALIGAGWFSAGETAYLGAANLAGYLAGALLAARLADAAGTPTALRSTMLLAAATFIASAFPLDFWWYTGWRFAAGLAGGVLMVLAPSAVLTHIPQARHGLAGGIIFAGVGLGIVLSGTLVPPLLQIGLEVTWFALAGLAFLLAMLALPGWRRLAGSPQTHTADRPRVSVRPDRRLIAILLVYALCAVGLVPHMVFLVDFVARRLGRGIAEGAVVWVVFGVGAVLGPMLIGHLADRTGFRRMLRLGLLVLTLGVGLVAIVSDLWALILSSLLAGAFVPGIVTLVLGRVRELLADSPQRQRAAWGRATIAFSVGQAAAAYVYAFLFASTGSALILFALGAGALAMALAIEIVGDRRPLNRKAQQPQGV
ncbi:MAG TPA: YbfB/YjiJ family MFS transporter [Alphaproteobacteria bacterium]|nr:YbfB/YjiJ family MFS transporter [Alphaproteobacteria bacterium]